MQEVVKASQVRWWRWLASVVLWPVLPVGVLGGLGLRPEDLQAGLRLMMAVWMLIVGLASIVTARELARSKGWAGFFRHLAVWLLLSVAGFLVSTAIILGSCAVAARV